MPSVSIIIVSYRVKYYIGQCIDSVLRSVPDAQIIVVDNNSGDGSVGYLRERFPDITVIAGSENAGFGRANNMALELAESPYVLFLNPDTVVAECTIPKCIAYLDSNPAAGACGVRMLYGNGQFALESRRSVPTPAVSFYHMSGLGRLFPHSRRFARYHMTFMDKDKDCDIEVISGAFMMVRSDLARSLKGFDEAFFMYGEDIDLSYRILKAGYTSRYISAPIVHYKGESTVKTSYRYVKVFYNAMIIFYNKHFDRYSHFFSFFVKMTVAVKKLSTFVFQNLLAGRRRLSTIKEPCIFVGTEANFLKARTHMPSSRYLSDMIYAGSCPELEIETSVLNGRKAIVFDTSAYSYEMIFDWMYRKAESGILLSMGLFNPASDHLITKDEVL